MVTNLEIQRTRDIPVQHSFDVPGSFYTSMVQIDLQQDDISLSIEKNKLKAKRCRIHKNEPL